MGCESEYMYTHIHFKVFTNNIKASNLVLGPLLRLAVKLGYSYTQYLLLDYDDNNCTPNKKYSGEQKWVHVNMHTYYSLQSVNE